MKKIVIIFIIIIAILFAAVLSVPVIFKDSLLEKTKTTINKHIKADVNFSEFSISLIRSFPKVTLQLKNVSVAGIEEFKNDTLIKIPIFRSRISLLSLFKSEGVAIEELILNDPSLYLKVMADGNVNWDITRETSQGVQASKKPVSTEEKPFTTQLQKIKINSGNIVYDDISLPMLLTFENADFDLSGNMYGTTTELEGYGSVSSFSLNYDSINYISKSTLKTNSIVNIDFESMDINIKQSELWINNLPFDVAGDIKMPEDTILFNLDFQSKKSGFSDFLALVPPDYTSYLEGMETEGTATLSGAIKGFYSEGNYPIFKFGLNIDGGRINYTNLPEEIKNISADIKIDKPQGDFDLTTVNINKTHAEIKNNPFDLSLYLSHLMTNPTFDCSLAGKINFKQLKDALPLDSVDIAGIVEANLKVKGNYELIEKKQYDKIQSDGTLLLSEIIYAGSTFTQTISIPKGKLEFSPTNVNLPELELKIGKSDMQLNGKVSNYLGYLFHNGVLEGNAQLKSSYLDINELMALQVAELKDTLQAIQIKDTSSISAPKNTFELISIPSNIDFTFNADIAKIVYDELPITNVNGKIAVKNSKLNLYGLDMDLLQGGIKLTGYYENSSRSKPGFDLGSSVSNMDITTVYNSISAIKEMFPEAGHCKGRIDGNIKLKGEFNPDIKILSSSGSLNLTSFSFSSPQLTKTINIPGGKLDFTSDEVNLSQLNMLIGSSDVNLTGEISNYLNYYNDKGILKGDVRLKSSFLNLNELMSLQVEEIKNTTTKSKNEKKTEKAQTDEKDVSAFSVPANVDIIFNTDIAKAVYGKLPITNIKGVASVKDSKLNLQGLNMNMLDGEMKLTGSYENNSENKPLFDFGFDILNFDIPIAFNSLSGIQNMMPVAGKSQGKFSTNFKMNGQLKPDMGMIFSSLNGQGLFNTKNLQINDSPLFNQLSGILKKEKLKNVKVDDFIANFDVANGNLVLKPFKTKVAGQETNIHGSLNVENILDMKLDFMVEREAFGQDIQNILGVLPGQERIKIVPATVIIKGPVGKPEVKMDLSKARETIMAEIKNSSSEDLQKSLNKLGEGLKKLFK